jgi:hypothetical protein
MTPTAAPSSSTTTDTRLPTAIAGAGRATRRPPASDVPWRPAPPPRPVPPSSRTTPAAVDVTPLTGPVEGVEVNWCTRPGAGQCGSPGTATPALSCSSPSTTSRAAPSSLWSSASRSRPRDPDHRAAGPRIRGQRSAAGCGRIC